MILDHPQQLAIALGIIACLDENKFVFNLIVSTHHYWKKVDINKYKNQFSEIHFFERPDYVSTPIRFVKNFLLMNRLKTDISKLGIQEKDIIIGFSIVYYIENIVLSMYPNNYKVAFMPLVSFDELNTKIDNNFYKNTIEGLLANWITEPLLGLNKTICVRRRLNYYTYWLIQYKDSIQNIFNKVVILSKAPLTMLELNKAILIMPFPYACFISAPIGGDECTITKKIVLFGTNFQNGVWNIPPKAYSKEMNKCIAYLRKNYGDKYKLVYRPHPAEKGENLNLNGFEIEEDGTLAELYFKENYQNLYAVFSVESTSSRSAYDFYINSYCFLELFPYDEIAKKCFRGLMGLVPEEFYIKDLSSPPKEYMKHYESGIAARECHNILASIISEYNEDS